MNRNKLIYATANYAVVMCSDVKSGGTWAGAVEQLERFHFCPVFVSRHQPLPPGNRELLRRGALALPPSAGAEELAKNLASAQAQSQEVLKQESLFGSAATTLPDLLRETPIAASSAEQKASPQDTLLSSVIEILRENLHAPAAATELAKLLNVTPAQMKLWLKQLTRDGILEQTKRPVRYQLASSKLPLSS
jgi:predicted Rossmann fold nucleotide-binding protein DprA/Smf involved in DNA uptake